MKGQEILLQQTTANVRLKNELQDQRTDRLVARMNWTESQLSVFTQCV